MINIGIEVQTNHPAIPPADRKWVASAEPHGDDILVIRNGLPYLSKIVDIAESRPELFEPARIVNSHNDYVDDTHRRNSRFGLSVPGLADELSVFHPMCESTEATFVQIYQQLINSYVRVSKCSGYDLLRYKVGEFFNCHTDFVPGHPDLVSRQLSVVVFCNGNFTGGELYFPRQKVKIKPEAGDVVLFPSSITHPHASLPVREGTKYSVVTWYH